MTQGPRILLFTGEGKGKTTAAMGMVLRAVGHGLRATVIQFIKAAPTGEQESLASFPNVEFHQCGRGFLPSPASEDFAFHKAAAQDGLDRAREVIASGKCDVLVLDEVCLAVLRGALDESSVIDTVRQAREGMVIVLTGRYASQNLIAAADTVTEMRCVKHGFSTGIPAMKGVEL